MAVAAVSDRAGTSGATAPSPASSAREKVREARRRQPALTNLLELLWLALGPVETRQILETGDDIGVIGFEGLPRDTERPTIEKLRLVGTSEAVADNREVIEGICDVGMRQTQARLLDPENPAKCPFRSRLVSGGRRPLRLADDSFDLAKLRHSAPYLTAIRAAEADRAVVVLNCLR